MKKLIVGLIVAFVLLLVISLVLVSIVISRDGVVERHTWLRLDLDEALIEYLPEDPFAAILQGDRPRLKDVLDGIRLAAEDDRVEGLLVEFSGGPLALTTAQELAGAIQHFRAADKRTVAWADTYGEWTPANVAYALAVACDRVTLQPSGDLNLTGLHFVSPFVRGTLEKLEIQPQMDHRHEYKNAMNVFTEKEFTAAHEEAVSAVLDSVFGQLVQAVASGRGLPVERVRELIDAGPYYGQEAVEAGLVDELLYRDQLIESIEVDGDGSAATNGVHFVSPSSYLKRRGGREDGTKVALVYGVGQVVRGESTVDPLSGSMLMGSQSVSEALATAIRDESVKAILFRVDSPGGSYVASDTIWRQTVRADEADKPLVVSMGSVAGSGGYFVAMAADRIIAQPATITGSIGVLGGKMVSRDFWQKLGITFDGIQRGAHADLYSSLSPYNEEGFERFQAALDRIYADFTQKVAEGRELPLERVQEIARGRIWSGQDALELGLVDGLGGYAEALVALREELDLAPDAPLDLELYPRPRSTFELLMERFRSGEASPAARWIEAVHPYVQLARRVGLLEDRRGVLSMPYVPLTTESVP